MFFPGTAVSANIPIIQSFSELGLDAICVGSRMGVVGGGGGGVTVTQRHSTCLKPPNGGFWNLGSSNPLAVLLQTAVV